MDIVIVLFAVVGGSIAFSAWMKSRSTKKSLPAENVNEFDNGCSVRKCSKCGHVGEMKTWISHYYPPKLIAVAGFLLGYIPGLIFLAFYWGKYKCPSCGVVGKSEQVSGVL
jgi:hypothetical protein